MAPACLREENTPEAAWARAHTHARRPGTNPFQPSGFSHLWRKQERRLPLLPDSGCPKSLSASASYRLCGGLEPVYFYSYVFFTLFAALAVEPEQTDGPPGCSEWKAIRACCRHVHWGGGSPGRGDLLMQLTWHPLARLPPCSAGSQGDSLKVRTQTGVFNQRVRERDRRRKLINTAGGSDLGWEGCGRDGGGCRGKGWPFPPWRNISAGTASGPGESGPQSHWIRSHALCLRFLPGAQFCLCQTISKPRNTVTKSSDS